MTTTPAVSADSAPPGALHPLVRLAAPILMVAGVLHALFMFAHPSNDAHGALEPAWVPIHVAWLVSLLLALLGQVGVYLAQAGQAGRFGLAAFVVVFLGTALQVGGTFVDAFLYPLVAAQAPGLLQSPTPALMGAYLTMLVLFGVGHVLFGASIARAGVFPRAAGLLLAAGAPVFQVGVMASGAGAGNTITIVGAVLYGLALAWLGLSLRGAAPGRAAGAASGHLRLAGPESGQRSVA